MSFQDEWLGLCERCVQRLLDYSVSLDGVRLRTISEQVAQIKMLASQVRKEDLFSVPPQSPLLVAVSTHENLQFEEDVLSLVAFVFDRHKRAVRLGRERAESVLSLHEKA